MSLFIQRNSRAPPTPPKPLCAEPCIRARVVIRSSATAPLRIHLSTSESRPAPSFPCRLLYFHGDGSRGFVGLISSDFTRRLTSAFSLPCFAERGIRDA